jgi:hypothetical protein
MRQIVSVEIGGGPCTADCPFYTETGKVIGVRGIPLKTHCRATMEAITVDCDVFNSRTVEKLRVTDAEWKQMQKAIGKKARKERKPYPEDHEEIHAVGYNWKNEDKWNAQKSSNVNCKFLNRK